MHESKFTKLVIIISGFVRAFTVPAAGIVLVSSACASQRPLPGSDVAPVLAAVVAAVDSAAGQKDTLAIDVRILPGRRAWHGDGARWSQGELSAAISPRRPSLDSAKNALPCQVQDSGCSATTTRAVVALSRPVIERDTVVVEAMYGGRGSDHMISYVHFLWFLVNKGGAWRVVGHKTLDQT